MSEHTTLSLRSVLSALAFSMALSAPAFAGHWHGYTVMGQGHPYCHGYPGHHAGMEAMGSCPYLQGHPGPAAMSGKTLGVMVSDLPSAMLDEANLGYGINVEQVQPDSPAAVAGIRAGDLIIEFAGKPLYSGDRLHWLVRKAEADKPIEVKLVRENKPFTVSATFNEAAPKDKCDSMKAPRQGT